MPEPIPAEVREILAPVRWSEIGRRIRRHQDGIVDEYLRVRGAPLLDEDGAPVVHANGRAVVVTQANFAEHFGIAERTFQRWLNSRGETDPARGGHDPTNPRRYDVDSPANYSAIDAAEDLAAATGMGVVDEPLGEAIRTQAVAPRGRDAPESARLRDIVLLMPVDDAQVFGQQITQLQRAYGVTTVVETVRRAVSDAVERL
jgi:hypothetical protein